MFWIALSALIMSMTGTGDDTYAIRKFLDRTREAVEEHVADAARRKQALAAVERASAAFARHRKRVGKITACVERADRSYRAAKQDYERCLSDARPAWRAAASEIAVVERDFRAALTAREFAAVRRAAQ